MDGYDMDRATFDDDARHDEGAAHFLARETSQGDDFEGLNGQRGEEPESPLAFLEMGSHAAMRLLSGCQLTMFTEIQASFAREVGEQRLPPVGPFP